MVDGPDFVVQIRDSSTDTPCLTDELRATIQDAIAASFETAFPGAYVDNACAGGPDPANEAAAFGVWLTTPDNPSAEFKQARRALLDTNIGRAQNETIAFYINVTLFHAAALQAFPPDPPGGSIHLHPPIRLQFDSPDIVVTVIDGIDEDPTPDVSFTLSIREQFFGGPRQGAPPWFAATPSLDVDTTWVDVLAWLVTIPLAFSPWFAPLTFVGWYQAYEAATATPPSAQGVASAVAALLMPLDIPIPGGLKIPIQYSLRQAHNAGVQVDANGMYVGGFLLATERREPSVALSGQTHVSLHVGGGDVDDVIQAQTNDMRGNLVFAWTVNGHPYPAHGPSITLSFNPSIGPFASQNVTVTVTDADGLTATANLQVTVSVQQPHGTGTGSHNPIQPA